MTNKPHLNQQNIENIVKWLCGLWAFGLGLRLTIELLASDGWIHIPKHPLNIWFDFLPLCIFGFIVVLVEGRSLILVARRRKPESVDFIESFLFNVGKK
ncbi:MAG: hypothetical protein EFT35_05270 [Methanophagales archaeon ANME-1-THS]|nr:MAG: hypothetical protein EFT35_05270 [Methanophagales archaeon ANME-1-THS]